MQDHVSVNDVNTTEENLPTAHLSRRVWGDYTTEGIHHKIDTIYDEIVVWRRNIFMLSSDAAGKHLFIEATKWNE